MRVLFALLLLLPTVTLAQGPIHDYKTTLATYQDAGACAAFFVRSPQQQNLWSASLGAKMFWRQQLFYYRPDPYRTPQHRFATEEETERALRGQNNDLYSWAVRYCTDLVRYTDQYR